MKRILFVDDEPAMLDALRGRLHRLRDKWEMTFVESGPRALVEMEQRPADVVVTDMRMPGMDGAQLLMIVSQRWPQAVRIVLSGYAEQAHIMRLVPVAHQFVSKPCDTHELERDIDRCLNLQSLLDRPELRALVGRIKKLPALPKTYVRVRDAMSAPETTAAEIAKIVVQDTAVAAKVLQLVNSAFFRAARRITNVEQAVTYLGFTAVRNLVMSAEVFSQWSEVACAGFEAERLHAHVHQIAAAMAALTKRTKFADDAVLVGLVHDIGHWVLVQECPRELEQAASLARREGVPLHEAETRLIGASHSELGAYLLGLWGLPFQIVEAVAHHHTPERVRQTDFDLLAALATAHALIRHDTDEESSIEYHEPCIDETYFAALHPPFDWNEAAARVRESQVDAE